MRRDFALQLIGFIDERFQLLVAVLSRADGVTFRQYPAGGARLDHVSPVFDLITNRGPYLLRAIGDSVLDSRIEQSRAKTVLIAMATANADCMSGAHHSWSRRPSFVDRLPQRHIVKLSHCA